MSADLHSPTTAGPTPTPPDPATGAVAAGGGAPATERPEVQAGLAFAGGLLAAMILKRLTR